MGLVRITVLPGDITTSTDEADVRLQASLTDVRTKDNLSDYTGDLLASVRLRITDRLNGATGTGEGTTVDRTLSVDMSCTETVSDSLGSACAVSTTADALVPGMVREGRDSTWDFGQVRVYDGGPDGDVFTRRDNTILAKQGIFVP